MFLASWAFFYKLGWPSLYELRDESRRARIAQEMLDSRDWIILRLEGSATLTKPPLYYWAVMLCSHGGVSELSARIP